MNINPVLLKELKVRMRGWKAALLIAIYIGILAAAASLIISISVQESFATGMNPESIMGTYIVLAVLQFLLIVFIAPSLTSGAISGERERQTLDILLSTRLRTISIILGKLFASISQVILLIVSSLPVFAVIFLFGGISILEFLQLFLFYIVIAVTMGSIGLFFSTYLKRTTASNVITYGVIIFLMFGTIFIGLMYTRMMALRDPSYYMTMQNKTLAIMYLNPIAGFASLISEQFGRFSGSIFPGLTLSAKNGLMPFWVVHLIIDMTITVLLTILTAYRINPVRIGIIKTIRGLGMKNK